MKRAIKAALLLTASLMVVVTSAHAAESPVVASGTSPAGALWKVQLQTSSGGASFSFSVGDHSASGYSIGLMLPIPRNFGIGADAGTQVGPYLESDLSGLAGRRATRLAVTMSSGDVLPVAPQLAPLQLRRSLPWLGRLRFFDLFLPATDKPLRIRAFDRDGRTLATATSEQGLFDSNHRP